MTQADRTAVATVVSCVAVGIAIAWAGSQGGSRVGDLPLFALCGMLSFGVNWLAFIPAFAQQTERYYDLTGSLTYLSVVGVALLVPADTDGRGFLLGGMVAVWAVRLGGFLFARIRRDGTDGRFDGLKPSLPRFLMAWTLQALWVFLTVSCALAAMTTARREPLGAIAVVGVLIWISGFTIEVAADRQKGRFRADPANRGRFIQSGLWAWSRHPNYFGEITLWCGVAVVAVPALTGWQYATLVSPVFVYALLTRVSGIPLLEARATKAWGDDADYLSYRKRTPVLIPRPPRPV
jgi:steroid 5-alpha reductase family enzyme